MRLAVPPQHAWARLRSIPLKEAAGQPLVVFGRHQYPEYSEYLVDLFGRVGAKPAIAEEHDSAASLVAAIESGAGVAVLPESFACSVGPRLKLIRLAPAPEPIIIGAAWSKDGLTPIAEDFLNSARTAVAASQSG